jgi:hypothetical protein
MMTVDSTAIKAAQDKLDAHAREIVQWHFSPETGCQFWLDWAKKAGWNPNSEVKGFADLLRFPHFQDEWLRDLQPDVWVPKAFKGKPFNIFETGGTTLASKYVGFIVEELLDTRIGFYPTYGNTLMGLAASVPLRPEDKFSITYYAPQPRAVLRVVDAAKTDQVKNYGEWGRVELTTLTREFFMPRFLERDEAIRREPRAPYAWDGVAEVRPFGAMEKNIVEGVY